jgi:hypothetical protein
LKLNSRDKELFPRPERQVVMEDDLSGLKADLRRYGK